jgi:hypothetical protein
LHRRRLLPWEEDALWSTSWSGEEARKECGYASLYIHLAAAAACARVGERRRLPPVAQLNLRGRRGPVTRYGPCNATENTVRVSSSRSDEQRTRVNLILAEISFSLSRRRPRSRSPWASSERRGGFGLSKEEDDRCPGPRAGRATLHQTKGRRTKQPWRHAGTARAASACQEQQ